MGEEVKLNSIVSNILAENNYSHCRLCLKDIVEEYVRFEDCVTLDTEEADFEPMKDVLSSLLGLKTEISEEIPGIDAICTDCAGKALESARFVIQCKRSTQLLGSVFDNLHDTLNIDSDTIRDSQKLYIKVSENETKLVLMDEQSQQSNKRRKKSYNQKNKQYECSECNEEFRSIQEVKDHNIRYHSCLTCDKCLETFPDETELEFHLSNKHKYKCEECPQFRSTKESLKEHCDRAHGVYVCKECGKSCKGIDKLHAHEQYHTTESNECPKCGKKYQTRSFFLNHTKLCLQGLLDPHPIRGNLERPYSCENCGKRYSTFGGLRVHMRFEHGNAKYHVCNQCGKKFTAPSCLKSHMITHTGEKNFHCDICGGKFVSKEALLYHTRRHTGEKPYSCNICEEKFVNASARAEHVKYKHVGPTLECKICSRKFVTLFFLRKHMERHHDPRSKLYHFGPIL